ncbi:MAG: hypothetical protein P4L35_03310 [Ignavibacteriaceae bacterium]|nr:hypothetical protein [Ignavibacteriaceae bacterium]
MSIKFCRSDLLFFIFIMIFFVSAEAQWVNNPALNTKLVIDGSKPINISSVEDLKGGAFIFWEDNKSGFQNEIFFIHMDGNGKVSFNAEGKKISELTGDKYSPVVSQNLPNTAVVVWKDYSNNKNGNLYAQRVYNNGNLLWGGSGVRVTPDYPNILDYSVCSDKNGNSYISYIIKADEFGSSYKYILQKINLNGQFQENINGILVSNSLNRKSISNIIADNEGGAFLFWLENQNNKSILYAQHIDSTGKQIWGKQGIMISNINQNVLNYSVQRSDFSAIYLAWQIQKSEKEIFHQLLSFNGRQLWGQGGKIATSKKGSKTNPQVLTADSTIMLSWTNEISKDKDIFIQKFNIKGFHSWKDDIPVVHLPRDQFGQKLLGDGKGGAIVAWIDKRQESVRPDIYAQRISSSGKQLWGPLGIAIASHNNSEKSYPSIVSDLRGGAIAIFKEIREGKGEIFAQKIFNSGTYVSQIIGLNAVLNGDSVEVSWYSANESAGTNYDVERTVQNENGSSQWKVVGNIKQATSNSTKYYEFLDRPNEPGTLFYRIVQKDNQGNIQPSDVSRVEFFKSNEKISLGQNSPDPFTDETTILFYLSEPSWVKFEFFNSHIELIKEIERQQYPKGENKIVFSGKGFPEGVYFYRVQSDDFVEVKKMVLAK